MDHSGMHSHAEHMKMMDDATNIMPNNMTQSSSSQFCHGNGMNMYMDGFRFTLTTETPPCLNYLLPSLTLNTSGKFFLAMIVSLLFGVATEYLSAYRVKVTNNMKKKKAVAAAAAAGGGKGSSRTTTMMMSNIYVMSLHGIHAMMGYVIMMIAMTFSIELLVFVGLGHALGYLMFQTSGINCDSSGGGAESSSSSSMTLPLNTQTSPCCAHTADEASVLSEKTGNSSVDGSKYS